MHRPGGCPGVHRGERQGDDIVILQARCTRRADDGIEELWGRRLSGPDHCVEANCAAHSTVSTSLSAHLVDTYHDEAAYRSDEATWSLRGENEFDSVE
jgi:hypothetical protein